MFFKFVLIIIFLFVNNSFAANIHNYNDSKKENYKKLVVISDEEKSILKRKILELPPEKSYQEIKRKELYFTEGESFIDFFHENVQ